MGRPKKEDTEDKEDVQEPFVTQVEQHLDRDANDPRNNVPAEPNLSDLNAEDPEK